MYSLGQDARRTTFANVVNTGPTEEERTQAIRSALSGLATERDVIGLAGDLAPLHRKNDIFLGELLLDLAADALEESGSSRDRPVDYEGIRERFLPEREFRGRTDHHKIPYAMRAAAMIRAGVRPDLLGEAVWWTNDDLWLYATYALTIYVRIAAERRSEPVAVTAARIAARHGVLLDTSDS